MKINIGIANEVLKNNQWKISNMELKEDSPKQNPVKRDVRVKYDALISLAEYMLAKKNYQSTNT